MRRLLLIAQATLLPISLLASEGELPVPLQLPPGLEQTLPVNADASYFGDALRAVDCPDDADNPYGTCGNLLFGGLAMTDAHISGSVHIKFYEPVKDIAHFEVTHPRGLSGDDSVLAAPQFYRFPVEFELVSDSQDQIVSEGDLNLKTGEVTNLEYRVLFVNTAIYALGQVNPKLEAPVIKFPGVYGSSWAKFSQRDDGLLDFTFYGSSFLPLGNKIEGDGLVGDIPRFPLPFCNIRLDCASIPSPGTSLHPHLFLSTSAPEEESCGDNCPDIPTNTMWQLTTFTHNTSFGDAFNLNIPQLGGTATGRSHLLGRIQIQFGPRFGDTVPFWVSSLVPAGLLAEPPETPLSIPGLSVGLLGHDEYLRFPLQTYHLQDVAFADDPFDLALGAIDLKTGKVLGELLYRGFIAQDLLFALLEQNDGAIAPSSFYFRGPALFEKGTNGQTVFRFNGDVTVDFTGFRYPSPDLVKANSWIAGEGSTLDPFLRIQAMHPGPPSDVVMSDSGQATSSTGDEFSYNYSVSCDPVGSDAFFEYQNFNSSEGGTFKMYSLASVTCTNSRGSTLPEGEFDTVTFSGFGSWSKDSDPHLATVQFSNAPDAPYISIIVDGGIVSNVNTKPPNLEDSLP
jgi:hypothetical protein